MSAGSASLFPRESLVVPPELHDRSCVSIYGGESRAEASPSGKTFFGEVGQNYARWLWRVGDGDPIAIASAATGSAFYPNFTADDSLLVFASQGGGLSFYDVATGKPKRAPLTFGVDVGALTVSPVGRWSN